MNSRRYECGTGTERPPLSCPSNVPCPPSTLRRWRRIMRPQTTALMMPVWHTPPCPDVILQVPRPFRAIGIAIGRFGSPPPTRFLYAIGAGTLHDRSLRNHQIEFRHQLCFCALSTEGSIPAPPTSDNFSDDLVSCVHVSVQIPS